MTYSAKIKGDKTNYNWPVEFGRESQTVGITQWCDGEFTERVLLSANQVKHLLGFLRVRRKKRI